MKIQILTRILFIPLILFLFYPNNLSAHESTDNNVIIHVNENRYEPSNVSINVGTKVTFENIGKEDHWPASDNHPSHMNYDGTSLSEHCDENKNTSFDSCEAISKGESWSFVFDKEGTYGFHDHLWPHLTGQVTVTDTEVDDSVVEKKTILSHISDFIKKMFTSISGLFSKPDPILLNSGNINEDRFVNLKNKYENLVISTDPRAAILTLESDSNEDSDISALCHDILHDIGQVSFQKYGGFKEASKYQSDFCNSGYIHGLFEAYLKTSNDPLIGLSEQCKDYVAGKRPFDFWQCYHGIGHGFMYLTGGDLDESLKLCGESLEDKEAYSCQNGAYMEVFNSEVLAKESALVNSEDPFLTCTSRSIDKGDCYSYLPIYLSQSQNMSFEDIFKECENAESSYRTACIKGVGAEAIKRNMNETGKVFSLCKLAGRGAYKNACIDGVVGMYMNQKGSYQAGVTLCEDAPKDIRVVCNQSLINKESFFKI